jgi:dihydropteroate synthase
MGFKNTLLPVARSIRSGGRLLDLSKPVVMGILNATPDSFFTGSLDKDWLLGRAGQMLHEGAAMLDIGGASSRPGAAAVAPDEEKARILPVIETLVQRFPEVWISVDTTHASVAEAALEAGASMINDISAGDDPEMLPLIASRKVPYVLMHMQGTPQNMQEAPSYANVTQEVFDYLKEAVLRCRDNGIYDVLVDPGFGFGKTVAHNYSLLNELSIFRALGHPVLVGISRKSMICKPLEISPEKALNGTTALHMAALREGAAILRVHDVKEAMETVRLYQLLQEA